LIPTRAHPLFSINARQTMSLVRTPRQRSITLAVFAAILCSYSFRSALAGERTTANSDLDRITYAVDGAESSHGKDLSMWRPDPAGPQGPMQVSEKAALDVGNGDRFEVAQNRALGRAYLALLYRRYGNWADAISAYNWGMGKVDSWIRAGRPTEKLLPGVVVYVRRVLHDSGVCRVAPGQPISSGTSAARAVSTVCSRIPYSPTSGRWPLYAAMLSSCQA
jgi:hypothetical protein